MSNSTNQAIVVKDVTSVLSTIPKLLEELVTFKSPTVAASIVAFILLVIPGVNIPATTLVAIVVAIGVVSGILEKLLVPVVPTPSPIPPSSSTLEPVPRVVE